MSPIAFLAYLLNYSFVQSKAPSFHSWNIPNNKIVKKALRLRVIIVDTVIQVIVWIGKRRATSTSKIKKSTTKRKNRVEKGDRVSLKGSNPHSNGDIFSSNPSWVRYLVKK